MAVIVGALAAYLIIIAYSLNKVSFTLGTVLIGVRAIAARCEPLREVIGSISNDVAAVEQAMAGLASGEGLGSEEDQYEEEDSYEEEEEEEVEEEYEEVEVVEVERPRLRRARVRR
ncbi:MAG: hypothetical protein M3N28_01710 [Actinomycetota bacterium]|nr:hypothetical protein [Actinomycetota bacterium]